MAAKGGKEGDLKALIFGIVLFVAIGITCCNICGKANGVKDGLCVSCARDMK